MRHVLRRSARKKSATHRGARMVQFISTLVAILVGIATLVQLVLPHVGLIAAKRQGLRWIRSRAEEKRINSFHRIVLKSRPLDTLLIIARTGRGLVENAGDLIEGALKKGVTVKFVLLDPEAIVGTPTSSRIDLRPLNLGNGEQRLIEDINFVAQHLRERCAEFRERGEVSGRLEVHVVKHLIENSLVALVPYDKDTKVMVNYDLSFGLFDSQKFIQHFQSKRRKADLCTALLAHYEWIIQSELCRLWFSHPTSEADQIRQVSRLTAHWRNHESFESIRNNRLRELAPVLPDVFESIRRPEEIDPPAPKSVQIEITDQCSTECQHCDRWTWSGLTRRALSTKVIQNLLSELEELKVSTVTFSGGEPLVRKDFPELVKFARQRGLGVGVLTNGIPLTQQTAKVLADNASWVRISIDGSNESIYSDIRKRHGGSGGTSAFEELIQSVELLKREVRNVGNRCKIGFCYTIQRNNAADVADMIRFVRALDLPEGDRTLTFKFVHGTNGFRLSAEQMDALRRDVLENPEYREAANISYLNACIKRLGYSSILAGVPTAALYRDRQVRCFTPYLFSLVDSLGGVYTCCYLYYDNASPNGLDEKQSVHRLGTFPQQSFSEIWKGAEYRRVRTELAAITPGESKYSQCARCTRHFNHNVGLTEMIKSYEDIVGDDPSLSNRFRAECNSVPSSSKVWL